MTLGSSGVEGELAVGEDKKVVDVKGGDNARNEGKGGAKGVKLRSVISAKAEGGPQVDDAIARRNKEGNSRTRGARIRGGRTIRVAKRTVKGSVKDRLVMKRGVSKRVQSVRTFLSFGRRTGGEEGARCFDQTINEPLQRTFQLGSLGGQPEFPDCVVEDKNVFDHGCRCGDEEGEGKRRVVRRVEGGRREAEGGAEGRAGPKDHLTLRV